MSSDKYAALDAAIIKYVSASGKAGIKFSKLLAGPAGSGALVHQTERRDAFRVLDARLQALRKAGKIKAVRPNGSVAVWVLAEGGAA